MQRQYAWIPEHHKHQLSTIPDVKRVQGLDWPRKQTRVHRGAPRAEAHGPSQKKFPRPVTERQLLTQPPPQKVLSRPQTGTSKANSAKGNYNEPIKGGGLQSLPEEEEEVDDSKVAQQASEYEKKKDDIGKPKTQVPWMLGVDPGPAARNIRKGMDIYIDGVMCHQIRLLRESKLRSSLMRRSLAGQLVNALVILKLWPYHPLIIIKSNCESSLNTTATCLLRSIRLIAAAVDQPLLIWLLN